MTCHYQDLGSSSDWSCSERNFSSTNQMYSPDLVSDTSSLWNFCVRSSDFISRENHLSDVAKCRLFSQATEGIALGSILTDCRLQCSVACNSSKLSIYGKRSEPLGADFSRWRAYSQTKCLVFKSRI